MESGRSAITPRAARRNWVKLKCSQRQEFVIGGYTDPQGARTGLGGLLVGYHNEAGELVYAGTVGQASMSRCAGSAEAHAGAGQPQRAFQRPE